MCERNKPLVSSNITENIPLDQNEEMHLRCHHRVFTAPPPQHCRRQQESSPDQNGWNQAQDSCGLDKENQAIFSLRDTKKQKMSPMASTAHLNVTLSVQSSDHCCLLEFKEERIPSVKLFTTKLGTQQATQRKLWKSIKRTNKPINYNAPYSINFIVQELRRSWHAQKF